MANENLHKAKEAKNDEFYTQLSDVAEELRHYKEHFKGKVVFCNCDDPSWSAFWRYFHLNFAHLGLKKLIATHYDREQPTYKMEYTGGDDNNIEVGIKTPLEGNGDFSNQECLDLLDECDVVVTNPPFSCYSSDTEVMTNHGWKLIKDVDISKDIIMSLNPENKQIEMVKAVDFISSPVNGKLYHFHNQNMDFCVTGKHRMYAYHKLSNSNGPIPFVNAEDVKKTYLLPLKGFSWTGKKKESFYLPETTQLEQYSRKETTVPKKQIPIKDWLEFFGFWLADGCWRNHINTHGKRDYTIQIKQSEKNESYVLDLIQRIGFTASISRKNDGNNNYCIYSKQLWEYLSQFGRSADKYIPREYLELDIELLKCLFKGYLNGDGSKCADGHYHLSSVSKTLIDNIQELILKIYGMTTQVRMTERKHSYDDKFGICYNINVTFERNTEFSKYGVADKVSYNDNVYCLTLERNHIMLVRHNGVIGWCGNCFREYVAQLMKYDKKFVIIGNKNAITYKEFFPLLKDNKAWIGYSTPSEFGTPEGTTKKINGLCRWFTNLDIKKRHEKLILWKNYTPEEFPKYDNYDAINVDKVSNIPCDYCESWMVTEDEFKAFPEGEWEVTRTEEKEGEKRLFIIPAAGTEFRKLLHEHAAGYREKIEKEISKNMQKNIFIDNSKTGDLQDRRPARQETCKTGDLQDRRPARQVLQRRTGSPNYLLRQIQSFSIPDCRQRILTCSRQRPRIRSWKEDVQQNLYPEDIVTEPLALQLHTLTVIMPPSLKSSAWTDTLKITQNTDIDLQSETKKSTQGLLSERYCNGIAGVPITFLDKYNPEQFEIVNANDYRKTEDVPVKSHGLIKDKDASITLSESKKEMQKSIDKKDSKNIIAKSRAEQSRAEQSRAEQSRAEQSRAEQKRTVYARICIRKKL